jgi:hypothetical protein
MPRRFRGTTIAVAPALLLLAVSLAAVLLTGCTPARPSPSPAPVTTSPSPASSPRLPTPVPTSFASAGPTDEPEDTLPPAAALVLRLRSCGDTCGPSAGTVILDDGRIIWEDRDLDVVASRLTADGLAKVRAAIEAEPGLQQDGNYQAQLRPGFEPIGHGAGSHLFEVGEGDDAVVVTTVEPSSFADQPQAWIIPDESRELAALAAQIADPVAWLGADAFAEAARPYQAPGYVLLVDVFPAFGEIGAGVDVDAVAWPFDAPIEQVGDPLPAEPGELAGRCLLLDRTNGAALLSAETAAGATRDLRPWLSTVEYDWARGDGWVDVSLLPVLPHQSGTCVEIAATRAG